MKPIPIAQYLNQVGRADPSQVERARLESVLLKPRMLAAVGPDLDQRLEDAFERGRQEGLAAARAESDAVLALERTQAQAQEAGERLHWQANEYARFSEKIERAMVELQELIAQSVSRILKPFLIEERTRQVTLSLCEALSRLLSGDAPPALKITGPEPLLAVLRDRLALQPVAVEYVAGDDVDVSIETHQTIIKSQLQAWIDHLQTVDG